MTLIEYLKQEVFEFDWDEGNSTKNKKKHGIETHEIEEAFYSESIMPLGLQIQPVVSEDRFAIVSETSDGKFLFVCFTIRDNRIRPIHAREANTKEKDLYE